MNKLKGFNSKMESFIDQILPELETIYKDIHRPVVMLRANMDALPVKEAT